MLRRYPGILCLLVILTLTLALPVTASQLNQAFKKVSPSVVRIMALDQVVSDSGSGTVYVRKALGSGVIVSSKGLIMTAAHVVARADRLSVVLRNGQRSGAKVVGLVRLADVALLQLDKPPKGLQAAQLGNSNQVNIGDRVFVVGAPYGLAYTLTVGHLSSRRLRQGYAHRLVPLEFLQTDASINPGNSGGPLCDAEGKVIGIVSHIRSKSGGSEGLGFSVSINTARALLAQPAGFWKGLEYYMVQSSLAKALNLPQDAGLLLQRVAKGSPGQQVGLKAGTLPIRLGRLQMNLGGDVILQIAGKPVSAKPGAMKTLRAHLRQLPSGSTLELRIMRQGRIIKIIAQP